MSCNGCRVLRKGCSDSCILRPCLQWIDGAEAQGNATVFVAKFFGRAGLMNFISAVPETQRPALFQSLLYEACGRTVNPVFGAVGLLWSGSWHACQAAVETVLRGGSLQPLISALKPTQTQSSRGAVTTSMPGPVGPVQFPMGNFGRSMFSQSGGLQQQSSGVEGDARQVGNEEQQIDLDAKASFWQQWKRSDGNKQTGGVRKNNEQQESTSDATVGVKRTAPSEVLAPIPRRVCLRRHDLNTAGAQDGTGAIDLDLTLGSHSTSPKQKQHMQIRVHSPCQSMTSEGSVTSVDTGDLKISLKQENHQQLSI